MTDVTIALINTSKYYSNHACSEYFNVVLRGDAVDMDGCKGGGLVP